MDNTLPTESMSLLPDYTTTTELPAYDQYVPPDLSNLSVKLGTDYITPETQVSSQLNKLLSSDSPYLKTVETSAKEQANKSGLLSSSMAVGNSTRRAIEAAAPIAAQDATSATQFQLGQQAAENQFKTIEAEGATSASLKGYQAQLDQANQNVQNAFQKTLADLEATTQKDIADLNATTSITQTQMNNDARAVLAEAEAGWTSELQTTLADKNAELQKLLTDKEIDANTFSLSMNSISNVMNNTSVAIANLLNNPNFVAQGSAVVKATFNNLIKSGAASIQFIGSAASMDQDSLQKIIDAYTADSAWSSISYKNI